jgi:hypothetical protein
MTVPGEGEIWKGERGIVRIVEVTAPGEWIVSFQEREGEIRCTGLNEFLGRFEIAEGQKALTDTRL